MPIMKNFVLNFALFGKDGIIVVREHRPLSLKLNQATSREVYAISINNDAFTSKCAYKSKIYVQRRKLKTMISFKRRFNAAETAKFLFCIPSGL